MGCPIPTGTPPTSTVTVFLRVLIAIVGYLAECQGKANSMEQAMAVPFPADNKFPSQERNIMSTDKPLMSRWTRRRGLIVLLVVLLVPVLVFGAWSWITLNYSYSKGERAGYVQKISKKGWLCKTWEGELAMANLPGTMPEIFLFSVRNDSVARLLEKNAGKRVSVSYEQHRGVPTSCFAETEYYITNMRLVDQ